MKGKIYKYDKATEKMIPLADANMMPLGEFKGEDGVTMGIGIMSVPAPHLEITEEQQRDNLRQVLRKADEYAEGMNRRDCVRVQDRVARMREEFDIDE